MPNRLAAESSPYLLQHAENPVDWYPWGDEAFVRARAEDRPIFLSIGYSACHWCHVMEHESFENAEIARLLNENFVSIKVDREERPDVDAIYMTAVQLITGRGGWPMSVFLTHDKQPFYGGTYWPPHPKHGMPGFDQVLNAVLDAWRNRRAQAIDQAGQLTAHVQKAGTLAATPQALPSDPVSPAAAQLERAFDTRNGGFGGAPKFPHPMDLRVLLRAWYRTQRPEYLRMVTHTLEKMSHGGIYDHLGGGFHRYAVDEMWLVPHFEKMLYDNALLTVACLETHQATGKPSHAAVARETLEYVLREMTHQAGGFSSTQDADSEGEEGKYYVWTPQEVEQVLGPERAKTFCYVYDVSPGGNFEGHNILNLPKTLPQCAAILNRPLAELTAELAAARAELLRVRERRVPPALDDKVIVAWNGLMIEAFALGGAVLDEPRYTEVAANAASFVLQQMRRADGRVLHTWRAGAARIDAYLDDYACLASALVTLYETTFDERWLTEAVALCDIVLAQFGDGNEPGFFYTAQDHEPLISRQKDVIDSSVPSGNAVAVTVLVRLGKLLGRDDYLTAAERTLAGCARLMEQSSTAMGQMLLAADLLVGPTPEIVLVGHRDGADVRAAVRDFWSHFVASRVLALREPQATAGGLLASTFAGKESAGAEPTVYLCQNFACDAPVSGLEAVLATWRKLSRRAD
ncbi:MAG: thioredoxin domain-containing protein [Pirellulales bacterium]|nr:thioredoxin domain-containing protein [Pirellulales bacterium]